MPKTAQGNKWMQSMMEKLGTDEAGVRAHMREVAAKSPRNTGKSGGFASLSKERLREIGKTYGRSKQSPADISNDTN